MLLAQSIQTTCKHCGTYFVPNVNQAKFSDQFCCRGCESVFDLLQEQGLSREFYLYQNQNTVVCPTPAKVSNDTYSYLDDPYFISEMSVDGQAMSFYLEGLNCTACLWLVEKIPSLCASCETIAVRMSDSTVEVRRAPGKSFAQIAQLIDRFGYKPHVLRPGSDKATQLRKNENRKDLIRIGVAAGCLGNIMILAVSLYAGATGDLAIQFRYLTALLALPVMTFCSWPFYKSTFAALRNRHLNIDVPIVAAIAAGIIISVWGLATGVETLFFDSLSMLVFLLLSSRFLLKRIQQSHLDTSNLITHLLLAEAERKTSSGFEKVSSVALRKGDVVRFTDSSVVCADGEVIEGHGLIHTATLTGESLPHSIKKGDVVFAGSQNLSGSWLMRVKTSAAESRLAQILEDVRRSSRTKPNVVKLADQAAQWFVGTVFALAFVVLAVFIESNPTEGASRALALIIVTCPCVFGMAIPLSMSLAIKRAAEQGIVIKDSDTLEKLTQVDTIFIDKTGTLTEGNLEVIKVKIAAEDRHHLSAAVALEKNQTHPVGRAIAKALDADPNLTAQNVRPLAEGGIAGEINGITYKIVPSELLSSSFAEIKTRYSLYCEAQLVATFDIGDRLRTESNELVRWANNNHFKLKVLSGDRAEVVRNCAEALGLRFSDTIAESTPERKSALLKAAGSKSVMIGDGANDAAALASASVGIAVSGSLDVSLRAADVYLTKSKISDIPKLFAIAAKTKSAIKRNLFFSLCFNIFAGSLAIAGAMTPLWAAVLMPMSSLTVLFSSLQASRGLSGKERR